VQGGTGIITTDFYILKNTGNRWINVKDKVCPVLSYKKFMRKGFSLNIIKKYARIREALQFFYHLKPARFLKVRMFLSYLPSRFMQGNLISIAEKVEKNIRYAILLQWNKRRAKFIIKRKIKSRFSY
jgi:hypothetical protein